jgi:CubicO group peptidase (beta-lactamase class C family)
MRVRAFLVLAVWIAWTLSAPQVSAQGLERVDPETIGLSAHRLERLSDAFEGYVAQGALPGVVVLIARHGQIGYLEAFGRRDRESGAPMEVDAIFRIASQTKALVSVAVMMLQEEGRLLIADPIGRYLPELPDTTVAVARSGGGYDVVRANRPITIRDLLTHTAGIGYGTGVAEDQWAAAEIQGWYFAHRDEPVRQTIAHIAELPFDAQPGERFVYGYNTDILGALVEVVTGDPLDVALRSRVLEPLGMDDTHFYLPREKTARLATVYSVSDAGLERTPDHGGMVSQGAYVDGPRTSFSGGAGLLSTAEDYAAFLQMLLDGGAFDGERILSSNTVSLMTVNHLGVDVNSAAGTGFGLGFSVVEDLGARGVPGSVGEFGWGGAYHSTYWVDPEEDLVVVYFTQVIPATGLDDQGKLRALVYQAIVD